MIIKYLDPWGNEQGGAANPQQWLKTTRHFLVFSCQPFTLAQTVWAQVAPICAQGS